MKFWMIVNIDDAEDAVIGCGDMRLCEKRRPSVVYFDKGEAEAELFRLKGKHLDGEFVLLESVGVCLPVKGGEGALRIEDMEEYKG